jgi:hypothetical protein
MQPAGKRLVERRDAERQRTAAAPWREGAIHSRLSRARTRIEVDDSGAAPLDFGNAAAQAGKPVLRHESVSAHGSHALTRKMFLICSY